MAGIKEILRQYEVDLYGVLHIVKCVGLELQYICVVIHVCHACLSVPT